MLGNMSMFAIESALTVAYERLRVHGGATRCPNDEASGNCARLTLCAYDGGTGRPIDLANETG